MTTYIIRRVNEHNKGRVFSTKGYKPWRLFFYEKVGEDRNIARQRERYWKSGIGKERLRSMPP